MKVSSAPIVQTFILQSDPDGQATIKVRQASFGDSKELADLSSQRKFVRGGIEGVFNPMEERALMAYLTLVDVVGIVDEDDKPLFEYVSGKPKSRDAFMKALSQLPDLVVQEIYELILEVNPQWNSNQGG